LHKGLAARDRDTVALVRRIQQGRGEAFDRDEGAGIGGMELRDPAASYLQYTASDRDLYGAAGVGTPVLWVVRVDIATPYWESSRESRLQRPLDGLKWTINPALWAKSHSLRSQ
jgi:hypothetical protein